MNDHKSRPVAHVRSSRTPKDCYKCGQRINIGQPCWRFVVGFKETRAYRYHCEQHKPQPSDLTYSDRLRTLYRIRETLISNEDWTDDTLDKFWAYARQVIHDTRDSYRESRSRMSKRLAGTKVYRVLDDMVKMCDNWANAYDGCQGDNPNKVAQLLAQKLEVVEE